MDTFEKVNQFLIERTGFDAVTIDMSLERDLGVTGDDAYDLIIKFSKEFDVEYWAIDSYGKFYLAGHKDNPTEKDWSMFSIIPIYP